MTAVADITDAFADVLGQRRGGRAPEPPERLRCVYDLRPGDVIDLEHDPYGDHPAAEWEHATVENIDYEPVPGEPDTVLVHCDNTHFACPYNHFVRLATP